ncbi:DUF3325 family protein [Erythrobacter sp. T5W1-R]|uniref:DUF3325 family protein n=1 Tax=Erythrobacter sp. T5W1-R TaxID=3101752 RepID=UPI002AFE6281|nr:DUF3325 family protein [Erythrobacter sp. T5W1-R]MEA1618038.1 DUF3325 family protein [Erythrobacter sp. T5W1-R]
MNMLLLLGAVLAALFGCALLALSQPRHWQAVTRTRSEPGRTPQRLGWLLLTGSIVLTILRDGASFAALFAPVLIGSAVLVTAMVLTCCPRVLSPIMKMIMPMN